MSLREEVLRANLALVERGLVTHTWGNVSGIDRERGVVAIKPSGVEYAALRPEDIPLVDLDGAVVEGKLKPSSDTPTHLALYRAFEEVGGVAHSHSTYATAWAQARREIPCLGTTHADHFHGPIPLADELTAEEIREGYEANTGEAIVRRFAGMDPPAAPAVLLPGHGPFAWGRDAAEAVLNASVLEEVARMAYLTLTINPSASPISQERLDKHFLRKHGPSAYYGQP